MRLTGKLQFPENTVKKAALLFLLALAALSLASEARNPAPPTLAFAPDVPPPSCAPDCPAQK